MADRVPGRYDFGKVVSGDTYPAVPITFSDISDLAGYSAKMQFRKSAGDTLALELTTADSSITLSGGTLTVQPFTIPTADSSTIYQYDLSLTDAGGAVRTYLHGSMHVIPDITR